MAAEPERCALCLKPARLCESHVVSECLYADLYEKPHRFSIVVADRNVKDRFVQKGIREALLCYDCEQLLGNKYENYGALAFREIKSMAKDHRTTFTFTSLDYHQFKLFQLTQLWRMAIAKHPHWQRVVLPESMREDLRQMLLNGEASSPDCYGVIMEAVIAEDGDTFDASVPPITVRIGDYHFVLATFAGFTWHYCAHKTVRDERLTKYFVTALGSIAVMTRKLKDAWHIQRFADELESVGKL